MGLDPNIWGPHYWFVIHSIALNYPKNPNDTTKKKYYTFIHDLPLFLPDSDMGNKFAEILDKYPVTPYLDSRDSFVRWTHFIHNKINSMLGKAEIPLIDLYKNHYKEYEPRNIAQVIQQRNREKIIFGTVIFLSISGVVYYYNK